MRQGTDSPKEYKKLGEGNGKLMNAEDLRPVIVTMLGVGLGLAPVLFLLNNHHDETNSVDSIDSTANNFYYSQIG